MTAIDRSLLASLAEREQRSFDETHPASKAAYSDASHLFGRVPMT